MSDSGLPELTTAVGELREAVDREREARMDNTALVAEQISNETSNRQAQQGEESSIRKRANRRLRLLIGLIAVLSLVFIIQNSQRIDDIVSTRTLSRIATCRSDNETAQRVNNGNLAKMAILTADKEIQSEISVILDPIAAQPLPADPVKAQEQQDFADQYHASKAKVDKAFADADAAITNAHVRERDCSPAAVDAFYSKR